MARADRIADRATIIDVANAAGVSYATVSRVLNNKAHVKAEKRDAVLAAMNRLGFVVNQQARSLASGRSKIIGLLVQNVGSSWMGAIMRGIDDGLAAAEYDIMLYTTNRHKAKESVYVGSITRGLAAGLLLIIPRDPRAYLDSLRRQGFPYVLIDHEAIDDHGPSVSVTNFQGAYEAMQYLLDLGHRRIGFITGDLEMVSARERLEGYRAALQQQGIAYEPSLIYEGSFRQPYGFLGGQALLALPERPTAIFASNDVSAFGVIDAARDRGLRIPDDLSVIGFDDIPEAASCYPTLTTVRQPLEQMGRMAASMLLQAIDNPERPPERLVLPTELIIRNSCRAL